MKYVFAWLLCLCSVFCVGQEANLSAGDRVIHVNTVEELMAYSGTGKTLVVTDKKRGGIFTYIKATGKGKFVADSGMTFPAYGNGYWQRLHDDNTPVHLSWFNAYMDSVTDDSRALKAAFKYPSVLIDGRMALKGGFTFPATKTVECTDNTTINILDSLPVKMEATFHATDYQDIFRGTRNILFGTRAVPYISACWFGARADCPGDASGKGTDNTLFIQKAINAAGNVSDVFLPPYSGQLSYRITSTITITKKTHFFSFRFHGKGTSLGFTSSDRATTIFADMKEGPAINIQGSRRLYFYDMAIRGLNLQPSYMGTYRLYTTAHDSVLNPANFVTKGIKNTYTAITTDAEPDNKTWSADIVFKDLQISGFFLAIGISQAGHLQGDRMRVERCQINNCTYGLSVGNAQNRAVHFKDVDLNRVWCGLTNTVFGNHSGSMFMVTGGQWCNVYKLFQIQPCFLGECLVNGLYTEAAGCIGVLGSNNINTGSVVFNGCSLGMRDEALRTGTMYLPPFYIATVCGNVVFNGCNFYVPRHEFNLITEPKDGILNSSSVTLRGCTILKTPRIHTQGNVHIQSTYFSPEALYTDYNEQVVADMDKNTRYNTGFDAASLVSRSEHVSGDNALTCSNYKITRVIPRFYAVQNAEGLISDTTWHLDTLSFTYGYQLQSALFRYVMPGDMLGSTISDFPAAGYDNPVMQVFEIDSVAHRVRALAFSNRITFHQLALYTNCFVVTTPMYGVVTAGTNRITAPENAGALAAGDFITFTGATKAYRIANIDTLLHEIRLMTPVSESINGRVQLYNQVLSACSDTTIAGQGITITSIDRLVVPKDRVIIANTADADIRLMLPHDVSKGHTFFIKKSAAAHSVIIAAQQGTIDGKKAITLKDNYQAVQLLFDGENYITIK